MMNIKNSLEAIIEIYNNYKKHGTEANIALAAIVGRVEGMLDCIKDDEKAGVK